MHELATEAAEAKAALPADHIIDTGVDVINKANVARLPSASWRR